MSLSVEEVAKIASLARLRLSSEQLARMTAELGAIVGYVEQLDELDTEGVEPMAHAGDLVNVFREDVLQDSLPRDEALANAPKRDDQSYLVPPVL
ncbi:MAG: Asp-tRNA(Asn)/Glu-tRNA(Gln) amidotransferase subunit GatC [Planctomycetales bacterium]|nr:Asp-tRNA(Asn)/Glu-tRNA(Gln) amidotransferase subunit GatC [Planctomycetales bacterium]